MVVVRVIVAMSGAQSWGAGDLYECDEASAARLVAAGRVEWIAPPPSVPETAIVEPTERAVRPRGRPRKT